MRVGLHVRTRFYCQILIKTEFSQKILEKYPNVIFN